MICQNEEGVPALTWERRYRSRLINPRVTIECRDVMGDAVSILKNFRNQDTVTMEVRAMIKINQSDKKREYSILITV